MYNTEFQKIHNVIDFRLKGEKYVGQGWDKHTMNLDSAERRQHEIVMRNYVVYIILKLLW